MDDEIQELPVTEEPLEKEFYLVVNYYSGSKPYAMVIDNLEQVTKADRIYKVRIPYRDA